jgi:hypothetical protein
MDVDLLRLLNPDVDFAQAGAEIVATLAAAAVALVGIYFVARGGAGGEIALGEGGVKVAFHQSDSIADLIDRAVVEQPEQFQALLARYDFYGIQDVRWTNRLREVELNPDVRQSARKLLFDLAGPFALPGTLSEADTRLYEAVRELNDGLRNSPGDETAMPANPFFTAIWRDQFDQKGVFETRAFSARAINLNAPPGVDEFGRQVVYVCAQELHDRDINVVLNEPPRASGMIGAVGRFDQLRFPCSAATDTLANYLARHPARFGLPRESFLALYGEPEADHTLPPQARALFQVAPINYLPVERRGAEGG